MTEEIKQTVWYEICRHIGTVGFLLGLVLTFFGWRIADTSTPDSPWWERTLYIYGLIVLLVGVIFSVIGAVIKKE